MKRPLVRVVASGEYLEASLPGRYRELITPKMRHIKNELNILVFGEKVARLRQVEDAWSQVVEPRSETLAFATDMTVEARAFLEELGVSVHSLRGFGWDEARYRRITS